MAAITLRLRDKDVQRALRSLRMRGPARIVRALNRAGVSTQTAMVREVARDMGIKQADVKKAMRVTNAREGHFEATVSATGARMPLIAFGAKGPEPSRGKGRGVTARMQGARKRYPHAFIARMRSGHRGVFQRTSIPGGPRLPIRELFGPSIPLVFNRFARLGLERGEESLIKNLQHEFRFLLQQVRA